MNDCQFRTDIAPGRFRCSCHLVATPNHIVTAEDCARCLVQSDCRDRKEVHEEYIRRRGNDGMQCRHLAEPTDESVHCKTGCGSGAQYTLFECLRVGLCQPYALHIVQPNRSDFQLCKTCQFFEWLPNEPAKDCNGCDGPAAE